MQPGNRERGWNDAPFFLHTETSSDKPALTDISSPRTILNKRVSHNFNHNNNQETSSSSSSMPFSPPSSIPPIKPPSQIVPMTTKEENDKLDEDENKNIIDLNELETILNFTLNHCREKSDDKKLNDDIQKRLNLFVQSWPKLNDKVKMKMFSLIKALEKSDLDQANDLHVKLILDFPSEVSSWMVGVKRLIHQLKLIKEAEETQIDADSEMELKKD